MAGDTPRMRDYERILRDLKQKRLELDMAIQALEERMGLAIGNATDESLTEARTAIEAGAHRGRPPVRPGSTASAYHEWLQQEMRAGKSMAEAAASWKEFKKRMQSEGINPS